MTSPTAERVGVSPAELKRAWRAVQSGAFTDGNVDDSGGLHRRAPAGPLWRPAATELVVPVIACSPGCGSTTTALALATAAADRVRLIECGPAATSGLVAASTAELGRHGFGWVQGTRDQVLLERTGDPTIHQVDQLPIPSTPTRAIDLTVLDISWPISQVLSGTCWMPGQIRATQMVVLVTAATVPGLRHLETALAQLRSVTAVAAMVGPPRKRWPKPLWRTAGPRTQAVDDDGRLVVMPRDRRLAVTGLDASPLPTPLVDAGHRLLELVTVKGDRS